MTTATNSSTGAVTIFDILIQGDTYDAATLVVRDSEDASKDFTGTTAKLLLKQCGSTIYQNNSLSLDTSILGEASYDLDLPPSVTNLLDANSAKGEVQYTFPFLAGGENIVKTLFIFNFRIVSDLIP